MGGEKMLQLFRDGSEIEPLEERPSFCFARPRTDSGGKDSEPQANVDKALKMKAAERAIFLAIQSAAAKHPPGAVLSAAERRKVIDFAVASAVVAAADVTTSTTA